MKVTDEKKLKTLNAIHNNFVQLFNKLYGKKILYGTFSFLVKTFTLCLNLSNKLEVFLLKKNEGKLKKNLGLKKLMKIWV